MLRSFLLAPANRHDLLAKFSRSGADCSVIDLEDGTPPSEKASARVALAKAVGVVRDGGYRGLLTVRVNEPNSSHYLDDLAAAFACDIDGVVIPKVEEAAQLWVAHHHIARMLARAENDRRLFIIAGIESVKGVHNVSQLCRADLGVSGIYFGAEDYAASIGGRRTPEGMEVAVARALVLMAAKAAGMDAIDQAVIDIRNDALFVADATAGRDQGYDGKSCVTPKQVALAHQVFSPTEKERDFARRLVEEYERALQRNVGVIEFEGKMVDGPILKRARAILAFGVTP